MRYILISIAAMMLTACATPATVGPTVTKSASAEEARRQAEYVIERRTADFDRVYRITERMRTANVELCPRKAKWIGAEFETVYDYSTDLRKAAKDVLAISDEPQATWIADGGPAAVAGLQPGDVLLAVNDKEIKRGPKASKAAARAIRNSVADDVMRLQVDRAGAEVLLDVAPRETCGYAFSVIDGAEVNAYADGDEIVLYRGLLRFVESDEELALVVGHELAHNAMTHTSKMQTNQLMGTLGGALLDVAFAAGGVSTGGAFADMGGDLGAGAFSKEFEAEADYVGMYFMARAGYPLDGVENFWRRMAAENPKAIKLGYSHPTTADRFVGLSQAREEIAAKRASGQSLMPKMKADKETEKD